MARTSRLAEIDEERLRSRARIEVTNQRGELVTVGEHILKWVPRVAGDAAEG